MKKYITNPMNTIIEWTEDLKFGILEIDNQHVEFIGYINQLYDYAVAKRNYIEIHVLVNEILEHLQSHFQLEEDIMQLCEYSEYESHKQEHSNAIIEIKKIKQRIILEQHHENVLELFYFLADWVISHIEGSDLLCLPELNKIKNKIKIRQYFKQVYC